MESTFLSQKVSVQNYAVAKILEMFTILLQMDMEVMMERTLRIPPPLESFPNLQEITSLLFR